MGKALPGRRNIVLDFNRLDLPDAESATSIQEALDMVDNEDEVFIIGGGSIYKQFLDKVDKLYMTYIDHSFDANIFFPEFDMNKWTLVKEEKGIKDEKNPYDYYFRVYEIK
jgi:dihydrofolate reductase